MATMTIKSIPGDLYDRLKQSAQVNRRSINSEVIVCLERALYSSRIDPEAVLARARLLRERTAGYTVGDDELAEAKAAGRP